MQISKFTDLSLRVLMYLSYEESNSIVKISEIAVQFKVPRNHLIKVVTKLNKLGWVHTIRGRAGGLHLAKLPRELKLGDMLFALEHGALVDCNKPICPIRGECNLKNILDAGLNSFYSEMNKYSLADVVDSKTKMAVIKLHKSF
jgi:Rrf2 family transcriptional regulator, nitric oxide-sensitive transcriptional repressor